MSAEVIAAILGRFDADIELAKAGIAPLPYVPPPQPDPCADLWPFLLLAMVL